MQIDNVLLKYLQTMGSLHEIAKRTENQALSYCREHRTQNTEPEHRARTRYEQELKPRTRSHTTTKMDNIVKRLIIKYIQ